MSPSWILLACDDNPRPVSFWNETLIGFLPEILSCVQKIQIGSQMLIQIGSQMNIDCCSCLFPQDAQNPPAI